MNDPQTIGVYDARAAEYARVTDSGAGSPELAAFLACVRPGGFILDLGCGPGDAAACMRDRGFRVDAVDASPEMVRMARTRHALEARLATFDDIREAGVYDAVWANFSLLHAPRRAFSGHLRALHRALVPGGAFHAGMKLGAGEHRDGLGRFYSFYGEAELEALLAGAGFTVLATRKGEDPGLDGKRWPWITLLARA